MWPFPLHFINPLQSEDEPNPKMSGADCGREGSASQTEADGASAGLGPARVGLAAQGEGVELRRWAGWIQGGQERSREISAQNHSPALGLR